MYETHLDLSLLQMISSIQSNPERFKTHLKIIECQHSKIE